MPSVDAVSGCCQWMLSVDAAYLEPASWDLVAVDLHASGPASGDECNLSQNENLPLILKAEVLNVRGNRPELERSRVGVVGGVSSSQSSSSPWIGRGEKVISLAVAFFILLSLSTAQAELSRSIDALSETSDLASRQDEDDVTSDVDVVFDSVTTADDDDEGAVLLHTLLWLLVDDIELVDDWDSNLTAANFLDLLIICLSILLHRIFDSLRVDFTGNETLRMKRVAFPVNFAIQGIQSERVRHLTGSLGDERHVE